MHLRILLIALALTAAACSGTDDATTTSAVAAGTTPSSVTTSTTQAPASTTSEAPTTTSSTADAPAAGASFAITTVTYGAAPMVVITNVGSAQGVLSGQWLCQRPLYFAIPDVELAPGEQLAISLGGDAFLPPPGAKTIEGAARLGAVDPSSGEMGLYSSASFDSSDAIVDYVEWGSAPHGRTTVAVNAGIWPAGGFVPTTDSTIGTSADNAPTSAPEDWSTVNG